MRKHLSVRVRLLTLAIAVSLSLVALLLLPGMASAQLPPGWSGITIGSAGGSETYDSGTGTYTLVGSGSGVNFPVFGTDNLHYTYTTATGDFEFVARLASASFPSYSGTLKGQAGLMFRTGNATADPMAATGWMAGHWGTEITPNNQYLVSQGRWAAVDGPGIRNFGAKPFYPPVWLKLVRIGRNFGSYWSLDGREWFLTSNTSGWTFNPTGSFNVGFFVSSADASLTSTATFDHVYMGAPRLKYETSWVGNSYSSYANASVNNAIAALWVKPDDGTCYANTFWDENGCPGKAYSGLTGKPLLLFRGWGAYQGSVTGNSANLFYLVGSNGTSVPTVKRADFAGLNPVTVTFTGTVGDISGMAASATTLFVSDAKNNLVRIVDLSTMTETSSFTLARAGPIAFDGTNFWVISAAVDWYVGGVFSSISTRFTPAYSAVIKCYSPTGADLTRDITTVTHPTAIANHPTLSRLLICDNGPNQNVCYYDGLSGPSAPTLAGTLGVAGGIWAGTSPGLVYNPSSGYDHRFYGLTGVGADNGGNIYVACGTAGTDLRKFNSAGTMQWRSLGLEFTHSAAFDPLTDGADIYTTEEHFSMNLTNTAPGSEWSYKGMTKDPMLYTNDPRNNVLNGSLLQRIGPSHDLFMFTTGQGSINPFWMYRLIGETARPFGSLMKVAGVMQLWTDLNGNNVQDAGETVSDSGGFPSSYDVDTQGDMWLIVGANSYATKGIRRLIFQGMRTVGTGTNPLTGAMSIPSYDFASGHSQYFKVPDPFTTPACIKYDKAHDSLYLIGKNSAGNWVLARFNNWLASPTPDEHPPCYVVNLPINGDVTLLAPAGSIYFQYNGLDVAGDKVFISDLWGPILVYDANLGNPVITLSPGPEISASMGWEDMVVGLHVLKRSTGEYLVTEEDAGYWSADLLYRWTPQGDTSMAPTAPSGLTAVATGQRIQLNWTGSYGMVTSYNLYRGTSPGSLTLYQSNITRPNFLDVNVVAGTMYYYEMTAISAGGESAHSNQASAAPLSSSADFIKYDTTTQGSWSSAVPQVYGLDGYEVVTSPATPVNNPAYGTITTTNSTIYVTAPNPTTDVRGVQYPGGGTRSGAWRWIATGNGWDPWSWNVNMTDGKWHQVAIYMMAWNSNAGVKVEVVDATTGTVLDHREPADQGNGIWLVWNIKGNVKINLYRANPGGGGGAVASGIFLSPVQQPPTPAVGWWKLDETSGTIAGDSSGVGNNATFYMGPTWDASGKINGCVKLPGGNAALSLPPWLIINHNPITVAAWFKTSSTTGAPIMGYANGATYAGSTIWDPLLYVGQDGKLRGTYYTGTTSSSTVLSSSTTVNNGQWHHAALVGDTDFQTLYLDGEIIDSRSGLILSASQARMPYNYIGTSYVTGWPSMGTQANFNGWLDDIRIYDRALLPSEIKSLSGQ